MSKSILCIDNCLHFKAGVRYRLIDILKAHKEYIVADEKNDYYAVPQTHFSLNIDSDGAYAAQNGG